MPATMDLLSDRDQLDAVKWFFWSWRASQDYEMAIADILIQSSVGEDGLSRTERVAAIKDAVKRVAFALTLAEHGEEAAADLLEEHYGEGGSA